MALDKDTLESLKIDRGADAGRYAVSAGKRWRKPVIIVGVVLAWLSQSLSSSST